MERLKRAILGNVLPVGKTALTTKAEGKEEVELADSGASKNGVA